MKTDSWLCGWRVSSDVPLPDLMAWDGDDSAPEIVVRLGEVPERLADPVHEGPLLHVAADGTCRYRIAGVATFLVEAGRRVTVQPEMDPAAPDVGLVLLGSVFGMLCHQRSLLPLHAGCVEIDGRAVAFAGQSGVGKSTLTAAFARRGFPVVADDVTVVDVAGRDGMMVLPAFPRLKLWRDTLDGLGLWTEGLVRSRKGLDKFNLPHAAGFRTEPLPLAAIILLETVNDARFVGIRPLRGVPLVAGLTGVIFRRKMALHAGRQRAMMAAVTALAQTPVLKLSRMQDLAKLDGTVDAITARVTRGSESGAA